ncbi:MAG: methyltransferase family protein [Candidatus Thorarchaeota archaeon]
MESTTADSFQRQKSGLVVILNMLDFTLAGPILGIAASLDVALHLYLDFKKSRGTGTHSFTEPHTNIPSAIMTAVSISTILAFVLVALIPTAWILDVGEEVFSSIFPLFDPPEIVWLSGLLILVIGIVLHGWSRYVRQDIATSWEMTSEHSLILIGPYSRIRHPSYLSYFLSFGGLILVLPSLLTLLLVLGFPGYYMVSLVEEKHLLHHFGNQYRNYMAKTGRFFPSLKRRNPH